MLSGCQDRNGKWKDLFNDPERVIKRISLYAVYSEDMACRKYAYDSPCIFDGRGTIDKSYVPGCR